MTNRNGTAIAWNSDNLPVSITQSSSSSSSFAYAPDKHRYYQSAEINGVATDTTYVGSLFEVVSTATDTEYRHNIIADGQIVAVHTIDQSGSAYTDYLHADHLGSVDAVTDDSGNVIQAMSFDAFGQRRDPSNWDYDLSQNTLATLKNYTDRGYTDQEQLDNLSLVDLNGRVYDPTVGRMISADPTVPAPFYSQAFNRYSYVYNSPFEYVDPSGYTGNPLQFSDCDLTGCFTATIVATSGPAFTYSNNVITESQTQQQNNIVALGAAPNPTVTVSPTAIGAPGATGTAATPVGTGGTSPIQPPWLAPINPPGPCQCNVGGDNQVGSEMDSTDGATTWDGTCFGCGGSVNPTVTDTRLNPDGPGNTGGDPSARTPISPQGLPPRPGVGPMHPGTTILGTMGATLDFGLGAVQYSRLGGYWLGKNWNIYNPAWGGNQYAGSRSLAPTLGEWAEVGSKALYGGEYIYGTFEYFNDLQTGNYNGALTVATNLALGGIFLELGPPGWIAGGIYFGIEYTIGWQSIFNANSNFYLQQQQTLGPGWNPYGGP